MDGDDDFLYRPHRAKGQRLDPAIKRMAIAAGSVSVVVIIIAWIWSGIHPYTFGPPPVINPPATPLRIVPEDPGGLEVPEANVPIMSGESLNNNDARLASPGVAPDITALDQAAGLTPPSASPTGSQQGAEMADNTGNNGAVDEAADVPKSLTPAASQRPRPGSTATSAAEAEGMTSVELAVASTEDSILAAWVNLQQKFPSIMSGRQPELLPSIVNGRSIWRLRLGGFSSAAAAQAFCNSLTSQGTACAVVTF